MFTFDSKHTRSRYKLRAQQQQETFGIVNRRQFGANYIPMISFHSQAPHVQGHFEIWKQVFTYTNSRHFGFLALIGTGASFLKVSESDTGNDHLHHP